MAAAEADGEVPSTAVPLQLNPFSTKANRSKDRDAKLWVYGPVSHTRDHDRQAAEGRVVRTYPAHCGSARDLLRIGACVNGLAHHTDPTREATRLPSRVFAFPGPSTAGRILEDDVPCQSTGERRKPLP